jgi:Flp pilus assembly protein protease CpaA
MEDKLQVIDKTSDIVSSIIPQTIVFVLFASFMIFLNLGLAFWLGEILGKTFFGFFVVAGFYIVIGLILHFFMNKWIKAKIQNYIIRQIFK